MPRAENRKRPPNMSGGGREAGRSNAKADAKLGSATDKVVDKKKELVERMKMLQQKKAEKND